jgi:hypothetical protein
MNPANHPFRPPAKGAIIELDQEDLKSEVIIHKNLTQDVVLTTEDKLKLALIEYRETLSPRAGLFGMVQATISFLLTMVAASFKDTGPISGTTWQAIYFFLFAYSLYNLITSLVRMFLNRKKAKIDYLIREIKKEGTPDD